MEACVRATLDALNRRLEVLPVQGTLDESAKDSGEDEAQPDVSDADQLVAPTPETESQDIRY